MKKQLIKKSNIVEEFDGSVIVDGKKLVKNEDFIVTADGIILTDKTQNKLDKEKAKSFSIMFTYTAKKL